VENEYCAKHLQLPVTEPESIPWHDLFSPVIASRSSQSSADPDHLSSNDKEYIMRKSVAKMTAGRSDCPAQSLRVKRLHSNSPPEYPQNWGQIHRNHNNYHSDPLVISCTFGSQISQTGRDSKRKYTRSTPISPMWRTTYSLSYYIVSEWRPVSPLGEM
jgi:hypothetical protein